MATVQVTRQPRLADDAATAALYVTHPERRASLRAPTATKPQNLNSHAVGGTRKLSHASAASAIAHANRKPVEVWQPPARQPAAEKAALCVKDYAPPQQPKSTTQHSAEGLGAAMLAVREQRASVSQASASAARRGSSTDRYHHTAVGGNPKDKALKAASGAYTLSRKRADSAPSDAGVTSELPYDASIGASRYSRVEEEDPLDHLDPSLESSRVRHMSNTNPKLYTSSPPVQPEVEERNNKNSQRAAAISMAKEMYKVTGTKQQTGESPAVRAAQKGQSQLGYRKTVSTADGSALRRAIALQEAAQKRAAEKLALMQDEHADYQLYYGTAPPPRSRLITRRKRTSSDTDASQTDAEQSRQIRNQMTSLRNKMGHVEDRQTQDRELLMQAARRNVDRTLQDMEARVCADTGRAPASVQRGWDEAAQARVRREAEEFEAVNTQGDRVNIGGQKYMDMADVDAVARSRLQPALDEITENAEQRRANEIEARLDAEEEERHAAVEREREADMREVERQLRGTGKRDKSESKVPKFFLWRRKGKRARVEESETEEAQAVSPVTQGAVLERPPSTAPDVNASTDTIPEQASIVPEPRETIPDEASVQTEIAAPESVAAVSSAPETEPSKPDENDVPVAIPRRPTRSQTEPLDLEQRDAAASGPSVVHYFTPPVTSPRADTKLKNWFRDRLVRRSSGPVPIYPHQPAPEFNTDSEPAFQGGATLTGRDEPRGAALGSHPLGETIPTHNRSSSYYSNDFDVSKINSADSAPGSTKQNGNGKRRNRLSRTFFKTVSDNHDESNDGDSRRDSGIQSSSQDVEGADAQSLRDSANGQGLTVPPTIGETVNGRRESRFSEIL
ncbi:Eisosome protein 1 [Penicillium concentricum]|uniref:Eisosome protein 1 n=1 Tax=Penicillium concentricum TaxID=293559 RepID=A0A9W9SYD7_9EURO|nr:Eisosome protein 1 [Penicillium concentricum]KAJ5385288.1 Eisosome protein 1 [Penicillium concentricum]